MGESMRGGDSNAFTNSSINPGLLANPAIHFAPVFKIMNGGNDFSTEPSGQPNLTDGANIINNALGLPEIKVNSASEPVKTIEELPDKMDFSKLIIKKSS
jgi:hypothetical protein